MLPTIGHSQRQLEIKLLYLVLQSSKLRTQDLAITIK
jgi:hypothetical protein